ncbi:hypothetical protein EBU71_21410 [bacterium]|nr:hypothetical protein [Candidatus Elulimicrobium humile]
MASYIDSGLILSNNQGGLTIETMTNYGFPKGTILMWNSKDAVPEGWTDCNGLRGTPNLQGRMPLGEGNGYILNTTGGSDTHQLQTNEMPSHRHTGSTTSAGYGKTDWGSDDWGVSETVADNAGSHTHTFKTGLTGGNVPHENMPPFYTLRFIMKL